MYIYVTRAKYIERQEMDLYSQKQDNRQRFQDKRRLKQKHATPSDRKYHNLKRAKELEEQRKLQEEAAIEKLGNNFDRYDKDSEKLDLNAALDSTVEDENELKAARQRIKKVLEEKKNNEGDFCPVETADIMKEYTVSRGYTSKDLHTMDVDQLNALLGAHDDRLSKGHKTEQMDRTVRPRPADPKDPKPDIVAVTSSPNTGKTLLPKELLNDQDFLDSMI